ncbi:MAG TPA: hypothetical protein VGB49_04535 [Caulobacteraceae bacterium]|jgi:hypothetical protein
MSGPDSRLDEFDPMIERLFSRQPALPDADAFARGVDQRLERTGRLRAWGLGLAGAVGGFFAVREGLGAGLNLRVTEASEQSARLAGDVGRVLGQDLTALLGDLTQSLAGGSMTWFWLASAAVVAAAVVAGARMLDEA